MASIAINLGDAFLIDTPNKNKGLKSEHLYIAIAQTSESKYLFVNVTTRRSSSENLCVLLPGSGVPSFIVHESVIAYKFAREIDATELAGLITVGSPIPKGSCSPTVLAKIQQGGLVSKQLMNKYKTSLKAFLEI